MLDSIELSSEDFNEIAKVCEINPDNTYVIKDIYNNHKNYISLDMTLPKKELINIVKDELINVIKLLSFNDQEKKEIAKSGNINPDSFTYNESDMWTLPTIATREEIKNILIEKHKGEKTYHILEIVSTLSNYTGRADNEILQTFETIGIKKIIREDHMTYHNTCVTIATNLFNKIKDLQIEIASHVINRGGFHLLPSVIKPHIDISSPEYNQWLNQVQNSECQILIRDPKNPDFLSFLDKLSTLQKELESELEQISPKIERPKNGKYANYNFLHKKALGLNYYSDSSVSNLMSSIKNFLNINDYFNYNEKEKVSHINHLMEWLNEYTTDLTEKMSKEFFFLEIENNKQTI